MIFTIGSTSKNQQTIWRCVSLLKASLAIFALHTAFAEASSAQRVSHALFEDVQSYILDNGLHVITAPRTTSDSVTMQLVVRVGQRDFPCDKQQIPHVIEHVMFENNSRHSPEELRKKVRDLGGASNGWTNEENTLINVTIHSDYEKQALETLYTMVQDLRWDEDDMLRVKRIVESEIETPASPIQRWLDSKRSVIEIAKGQLYSGTTLDCTQRSEAATLSSEEIRQAYETYYHPNNMTLILVGNLSESSVDWVREKFANISAQPITASKSSTFTIGTPTTDNPPILEKGGYGSAQAWVNLLTRMPGSIDDDFVAAKIITEYFNEKLFSEVRLKYGIGYTPNAFMMEGSDTSELIASTKTRSDFYALAEKVFMNVYNDLRENKIRPKELQRLKRKLTLNFEAKERDSLEIAALYRLYRYQIREIGHMPNVIEQINAVTPTDIERVIGKYFPAQPLVAILRPPSPMEAGFAVAGIITGAAILGWPLNLWIQRRRQSKHQQKGA